MDAKIKVDTEVVDIGILKSYPINPRRGDVEEIAKSLDVNGQYKPIVVNRRDNTILAGNHTWRAARSLGWKEIAVSWVDVDDMQARKIVLADNRTADMSIYDDFKLLELLQSIPSLDGTAFKQVDIDQLQSLLNGQGEFEVPNVERTGKVGDGVRVCVGSYRVLVDDDAYKEWSENFESGFKDQDSLLAQLKKLLNLSDAKAIPPQKRKTTVRKKQVAKTSMKNIIDETVNVDINSVFPYPMNARQGDIGSIAESLKENGQFRPIVVNRLDNSILVGNHTWKAAKMLGWKEIAATFVDVDDEAAARIVLVDNKTADLGTYDHVELAEMLREMTSFEGTGYDGDDVDELVREVAGWGIKEAPQKASDEDKPRNVTAIIGKWEIKFERSYFDAWEEEMFKAYGFSFEEVCAGIVEMLDIPNDAWVSTRQRRSKRKSARRSE
jgi:ParB-like chromosome segregation protein Spo0J